MFGKSKVDNLISSLDNQTSDDIIVFVDSR